MKYKRFEVVELKNENKAVILEVKKNNEYFAEIVDSNGNTIENRIITNSEISKIIYSKEKER